MVLSQLLHNLPRNCTFVLEAQCEAEPSSCTSYAEIACSWRITNSCLLTLWLQMLGAVQDSLYGRSSV